MGPCPRFAKLTLIPARAVNFYKNFREPTAPHVPVLLPNREKHLFDFLRSYQFADGDSFDYCSTRQRLLHADSWGDSNERAFKDFIPTFETNRKIFEIGSFKLDWFFVETAGAVDSYLASLRSVIARELVHLIKMPDALDPHDDGRVSDHNPSIVYPRTKK